MWESYPLGKEADTWNTLRTAGRSTTADNREVASSDQTVKFQVND